MVNLLKFVGAALFLLLPAVGQAETTSCEAVTHWASVHHDPSIAVSFTSKDTGTRYCRFSINGFVADPNAPADIRKQASVGGTQVVAMQSTKSLQDGFVGRLASLLFAADETIDLPRWKDAFWFLDENAKTINQCYSDFLSGKNGVAFKAESKRFSLTCRQVSERRLQTSLVDQEARIVRAAFLLR